MGALPSTNPIKVDCHPKILCCFEGVRNSDKQQQQNEISGENLLQSQTSTRLYGEHTSSSADGEQRMVSLPANIHTTQTSAKAGFQNAAIQDIRTK